MGDDAVVLFVTAPSPLRDGLEAVFMALTSVIVVEVNHGDRVALSRVATCRPDLVVIAVNLAIDALLALLQRIKVTFAATPCFVLVTDVRQRDAVVRAGADVVMLEGTPARELFATLEGLVSRKKE